MTDLRGGDTMKDWAKRFDEISPSWEYLVDELDNSKGTYFNLEEVKLFISSLLHSQQEQRDGEIRLQTQNEIFEALDKLEMPKPLMALVKDSIGVTTPEMDGLSSLLKESK